MKKIQGYTLLELMITVAIVGIAARFILPGIDAWTLEQDFENAVYDMERDLQTARELAQLQNTTARVLVVRNQDEYTVTTYLADSPTSLCSTSGSWTPQSARTFALSSIFELTGSCVCNVCFFRDNTATGGTYNFLQKDGGTDYGIGTLQVTIATGFIDVIVGS